ncbi:MAG: LysM peptidoglycan-binding domain-containing protein [Planctomycetota bacterium]|jgi:nucleoid-associated protein YgaU|nr:LysM peptidoglycan-binding domain-containing protein [Planctomycetota bacterium]
MENGNLGGKPDDYGRPEAGAGRGRPDTGSLITAAVAVLLLFAVLTRMGKPPERLSLLEWMDNQSEKRIRSEGERLKAMQILGAVPGPAPADPENPPDEPESFPPLRIGLLSGIGADRDPAVPDPGRESGTARPEPESPPAEPGAEGPGRPGHYLVAEGDTWVKISRRTLGDANRWREILAANPAAQNGLKVNMRLIIP